jgi:hypothetical protein
MCRVSGRRLSIILHGASLIKKYVKYLKKGYSMEFAELTQIYYKIIGMVFD